jgi:hypothetical protein
LAAQDIQGIEGNDNAGDADDSQDDIRQIIRRKQEGEMAFRMIGGACAFFCGFG